MDKNTKIHSEVEKLQFQRLSEAESALEGALEAIESIVDEAKLRTSTPQAAILRRATALEEAIDCLPKVVNTERGQKCLALIAEARHQWSDAADCRLMQVCYMAFMRELGHMSPPNDRDVALKVQYPPKLVAKTYALMERNYRFSGTLSARNHSAMRKRMRFWQRASTSV